MKFKVDDVVKIVCADGESSTPNTRGKIGQVGKIIELTGYPHIPYCVFFEEGNDTLNFMEKEIALDVKIGQQLEFAFMEK